MPRVDSIRVGVYRLHIGGAHGVAIEREPEPGFPAASVAANPRPPSPAHAVGSADRAHECALIASRLKQDAVVRVVGPAGIGMTTVLRQIAARPMPENLPDGVFYMHESGDSIDDIVTGLFALRFVSGKPVKHLPSELSAAFASLKALVVLDGASLSPEKLSKLGSILPDCRILVGEGAIPSNDPTVVNLPPLADDDAVSVFEDGLRRPVFASRAAATEICRALRGVPALIRWAGATARECQTPLIDLASVLNETDGLARYARSAFDIFSAPERDVVGLLAVTEAAIDGALIKAMVPAPNVENIMLTLAAREVITADPGQYELVAGIRHLVPAQWVAIRDLKHAATALESHVDALAGEPVSGSLATLAARLLGFAHENSEWRIVVRLGRAVSNTLALSGRWDAWESALDHVRLAGAELNDKAVVAWALHELGARAIALGKKESAPSYIDRALALRTEIGDHAGVAATNALQKLIGRVDPSGVPVEEPQSANELQDPKHPPNLIEKAKAVIAGQIAKLRLPKTVSRRALIGIVATIIGFWILRSRGFGTGEVVAIVALGWALAAAIEFASQSQTPPLG